MKKGNDMKLIYRHYFPLIKLLFLRAETKKISIKRVFTGKNSQIILIFVKVKFE
jgi:hypothetical protein